VQRGPGPLFGIPSAHLATQKWVEKTLHGRFQCFKRRPCQTVLRGHASVDTSPGCWSRVIRKIHDETTLRWNTSTPEKRVEEVNRVLRRWCNYFDHGPVFWAYRTLGNYAARRLRRWLMRKHDRQGTGYRQYSDEYLCEKLGLYKP